MAGFFDKVGAAAKSAATMTGELAKDAVEKGQDMVEITKINSNIKDEEKQIEEAQKSIGEIIFKRFTNNDEIDEQLREICDGINARIATIDGLKAEIERIKSE